MASRTNYLAGYKPARIQHQAYRTAENSAEYLIPRIKKLAEARPELQFLDVGAGPGSLSASFAKYIPQGIVVATDISEDVLQQAKNHAEQVGCTNIRFQIADVYDLPFPDDSFDVVHASQVLIHLSDPVTALKEMFRVCKPGGLVAAREAEPRTFCCVPDLPPLRDFLRILAGFMARESTGLSLPSFAQQAGVDKSLIQFNVSAYGYRTPEERRAFGGACKEMAQNGAIRHKALANNLATAEALDDMVKAWDEWIEDDFGCNVVITGELVINKPH